MIERIELLYYPVRIWLSVLVGRCMRRSTFRFSREYRWGVTWYHRAVYATICTFLSNVVADGCDAEGF